MREESGVVRGGCKGGWDVSEQKTKVQANKEGAESGKRTNHDIYCSDSLSGSGAATTLIIIDFDSGWLYERQTHGKWLLTWRDPGLSRRL